MRTPLVSGEQLLFEAEIVRGSALAELAAWTELFRPMIEASRQIGMAFRQAAESMQRAMVQIGRAMECAGRDLSCSARRPPAR